MKVKRVEKKDANTKIIPRRIIEEETEELGEKPLCRSISGKSIHYRIS